MPQSAPNMTHYTYRLSCLQWQILWSPRLLTFPPGTTCVYMYIYIYMLMYIALVYKTDYGRRDPLRWPRDTLYPQKLALTSPTSGGRSVGIVRSRTEAIELLLYLTAGTKDEGWIQNCNRHLWNVVTPVSDTRSPGVRKDILGGTRTQLTEYVKLEKKISFLDNNLFNFF
jgi:hypothetical protein